MNSQKIFLKRYIEDVRYQWDLVFHLVGSPIIFLYTVGLGSFFGFFFLRDIWENTADFWPAYYPFWLLLLIHLVLISGGVFRTFLFEADLLYLIQSQKKMSSLRRYGFFTSTIKSILQATFLLALSLPIFLFSYEFSFLEVGLLLMLLTAYKLLLMTIRKYFKGQVVRWFFTILIGQVVRWFFTILIGLGVLFLIMMMQPMIWGVIGFFIIMGIGLYQLKIAQVNYHFYREIEADFMDRNKYLRLMAFITNFDPDAPVKVEKPSSFKRSKARILFPKSNRIFKKRTPENGLLEFCLKAFLRNPEDRALYFRVMAIPSFIAVLLPVWWFKVVLFFFFIYAMYTYMTGVYFKITSHSFFQIVPVDEVVVYRTLKWFLICTMIPAVVILGFSWFLPFILI